MNKLCMLSLSMFMIMCIKSQTYTLTTSNVTYTELTGATDITGGQLWDDLIWTSIKKAIYKVVGK